MRFLTAVAAVVALPAFEHSAGAQNATIQQPAFGRFSVGTTVSVPDRGRAYLGSVARAGEGRKSFGPFQRGSSVGLFREHSGVSASVYIHDLREMDQRLLRQDLRSARRPGGRALSGRAEYAYRRLIDRHYATSSRRPDRGFSLRRSAVGLSSRAEARLPAAPSRPSVFGNEDPAAKFYRLGVRAERRGKLSLARLHFRMAAKHGSASAKAKLASRLKAVASRKQVR
ncbi:MAG: hypothetical protein ACE5KM_10610 [Planctomycetaceae bacterium]